MNCFKSFCFLMTYATVIKPIVSDIYRNYFTIKFMNLKAPQPTTEP